MQDHGTGSRDDVYFSHCCLPGDKKVPGMYSALNQDLLNVFFFPNMNLVTY